MVQKDDFRKTLIKKSFGPQGRFPSLPWDFYIITQWSCIAHQDHCRRWIRTRDLKRLSILIQKTEVYHLYVSISKITVEFIQRPEDLKKNLKPVSSLAGNIKIGFGNISRHFHRSISGVFTILRQLHLENSKTFSYKWCLWYSEFCTESNDLNCRSAKMYLKIKEEITCCFCFN